MLPGVDLTARNDNAAAEPAEPPPTEQEKKKKGSGASAVRGASACVTTKHVTLKPESIGCRCCGEDMVVIGEETSSVTERIPARYEQTITHRPKYACNRCRQGGVSSRAPEDPPVSLLGFVLGPRPRREVLGEERVSCRSSARAREDVSGRSRGGGTSRTATPPSQVEHRPRHHP